MNETILEKQSRRKCLALRRLVENGDYSPAYALQLLEDYYDKGKIIDNDYDELATWLEELLNTPIEPEPTPEPEPEIVEENNIENQEITE